MVSIKAAINQGPLAFHLDRRPDGTEYMSELGNILYWSKKKKNTPPAGLMKHFFQVNSDNGTQFAAPTFFPMKGLDQGSLLCINEMSQEQDDRPDYKPQAHEVDVCASLQTVISHIFSLV